MKSNNPNFIDDTVHIEYTKTATCFTLNTVCGISLNTEQAVGIWVSKEKMVYDTEMTDPKEIHKVTCPLCIAKIPLLEIKLLNG